MLPRLNLLLFSGTVQAALFIEWLSGEALHPAFICLQKRLMSDYLTTEEKPALWTTSGITLTASKDLKAFAGCF